MRPAPLPLSSEHHCRSKMWLPNAPGRLSHTQPSAVTSLSSCVPLSKLIHLYELGKQYCYLPIHPWEPPDGLLLLAKTCAKCYLLSATPPDSLHSGALFGHGKATYTYSHLFCSVSTLRFCMTPQDFCIPVCPVPSTGSRLVQKLTNY